MFSYIGLILAYKGCKLNYYRYICIVIVSNCAIMEDIYILSDTMIQRRIGEKLKADRLKQNITQQSLAKAAEVSPLSRKLKPARLSRSIRCCVLCGYSANWMLFNRWSRKSS